MSEHATSFKPSLRLFDATMIVAGSMIGSGIFIVSADIVRNVGSAGWLIIVWAITGFMTLMAAVSYGEMSGMFPKAGGQYVYFKEAYQSTHRFLVWMEFIYGNSNCYYCRCGCCLLQSLPHILFLKWVKIFLLKIIRLNNKGVETFIFP